MGLINYQKSIKESISALESRLKTLTSIPLRNRCEVLIWLKSGKVKSMRACMVLKNMNKSTGADWWRIYQSEGLEGLLSTHHKGRTSVLDTHKGFWQHLNSEGFASIQEAIGWLADNYKIYYTENGLGSYFRRHKIKLKTGRPFHPSQSEEARLKYKKNIKKN